MILRSRQMMFLALILFLAVGSLSAVSALQDGTDGGVEVPAPVVTREVLAVSEPVAAPGMTLELTRITIPTELTLAIHDHPGDQMALVESGVLTYHVLGNGVATVTRAGGSVIEVSGGQSILLLPGDTIVEPAGMVHYGENLGTVPVVLLVASLFETGAPASSVVDWIVEPEATPVASPAATPLAA